MIKSAKKEKYYGTLAYAQGEIRKVVSYTKRITEGADGIKHTEYWTLKNLGCVSKIVSVEAYKIMTALDTVTAVVKVDGRTYIGHAQCNPSDEFNGAFGRKLALARAMHDHAMVEALEEYSNWKWDFDDDADGDEDDDNISAGDVDGSNVWYCCHCGEPVHKDEAIADHYTDDIYCSETCFYAAGGNIDPDGDDDDDEEFISAGDVDGTETLYCCQCGEPMDADEAIPDSYTDDIYCCQSCYLAAGGNIDPDGDDDDGDNLCDYCLEEIVTPVYDADGHEYCCEECMQKALEENANEEEDDED